MIALRDAGCDCMRLWLYAADSCRDVFCASLRRHMHVHMRPRLVSGNRVEAVAGSPRALLLWATRTASLQFFRALPTPGQDVMLWSIAIAVLCVREAACGAGRKRNVQRERGAVCAVLGVMRSPGRDVLHCLFAGVQDVEVRGRWRRRV